MSYAQDLLEQAERLIHWDGADPKQASLRLAVSTAYYALFHLLIDEAVGNWPVARQRNKLARIFEHKSMKRVCDDCVKDFRSAGMPASKLRLTEVARAFSELQLKRHTADYDNTYVWTKTDAQDCVYMAGIAFNSWDALRTEDESQDFLFSLLLPKPPRP